MVEIKGDTAAFERSLKAAVKASLKTLKYPAIPTKKRVRACYTQDGMIRVLGLGSRVAR